MLRNAKHSRSRRTPTKLALHNRVKAFSLDFFRALFANVRTATMRQKPCDELKSHFCY
jgi:hypothetical protein